MTLEISTEIKSMSELRIVYNSLRIERYKCLPIVITLFIKGDSKNTEMFITVESLEANLLVIDDIKMGEKLLNLIKLILIKNYRIKIDFIPDCEFIDLVSEGYGILFTNNSGTLSAPPKMLHWEDKNTFWTLGVDSGSFALLVNSPRNLGYFCRRDSDIRNEKCKRLVRETLQRFFAGESFHDKIFRNSVS